MEWIKCSDRMPELDAWVLIYSKEKDLIACSFTTPFMEDKVTWNMLSSGCGCCD